MFKPLGFDQLIDLIPAGPELPAREQRGIDHFCLSVSVLGDPAKRFGAFGDGPSIYIRDPGDYTIELKPRTS